MAKKQQTSWDRYRNQFDNYAHGSARETAAQTAKTTGGYGNSYGNSSAGQAMDNYMTGANNRWQDINGTTDQVQGAAQMWNNYADQYIRQGRQDMRDTMGKWEAQTGGYGNSLATGKAESAYLKNLEDLNQKWVTAEIPKPKYVAQPQQPEGEGTRAEGDSKEQQAMRDALSDSEWWSQISAQYNADTKQSTLDDWNAGMAGQRNLRTKEGSFNGWVNLLNERNKAALEKDKQTQKEMAKQIILPHGWKKVTGDNSVDLETGETVYDPWTRYEYTGNKYIDSLPNGINSALNGNVKSALSSKNTLPVDPEKSYTVFTLPDGTKTLDDGEYSAAWNKHREKTGTSMPDGTREKVLGKDLEGVLGGRLHDLNKLPESIKDAQFQSVSGAYNQQLAAEQAVQESAVEANGKQMYIKPDGTVTDDYWNAVLSWSSDIPAMWEYATTGQLKTHDGTVIYGGDADKPDQNDIKANEPFAWDGMSSATATKPKDMLRLDGMTMAAPASGVQGGVTEVPPQKQSGFDDFLAQYANAE